MRKWQDLAAQDDVNSWSAVSNVLPNNRGTYELAWGSTGTNYAATGAQTVRYAFAVKTLTSSREYVVDAGKIWEWSGAALTDRTGGVTIGGLNHIMMAQYGNVTICVMGAANPTVKSTGGNFSALAGAPQGEIICTQRNAVLIFNTSTSADGWAASDVGDYTNWATGEAASGRIIDTPGPIVGAVPYGNDVIVFKPDAIYRGTYVGGVVKWQFQLVWKGLGGYISYDTGVMQGGRFNCVATQAGVAFCGGANYPSGTLTGQNVYVFDGSSPPRRLNPLTTIATNPAYSSYHYNPSDDVLTIAPLFGSNASGTSNGSSSLYYYYCFDTDTWGAGSGGASEVDGSGNQTGHGVLFGEWRASSFLSEYPYSKPVYWAYRGTADTLTRNGAAKAASCYLQSSKHGRADGQTTFNRLIPLLRRRTDLGTDSASLTFDLFNELEDTSAVTSRTVSEASNRKRFDLLGGAASAPFGRFKVTWTALDVEVDDFLVKSSFVQDGG